MNANLKNKGLLKAINLKLFFFAKVEKKVFLAFYMSSSIYAV